MRRLVAARADPIDRLLAGEAARTNLGELAEDETTASLVTLGRIYEQEKRYKKARECFEKAVELQPGHVEANLNLGAMREEAGADEVALRHYRAALETDPLFPDTHVSLALLYERLGLPRTARSHWRRYLMLDARGAWADVARRRLAEH